MIMMMSYSAKLLASVLLLGSAPSSLAYRRQNASSYQRRRGNRFALTPTVPPITRENESAVILLRGGDDVGAGDTGIINSAMPTTVEPTDEDAKLRALERLKTDPSSIPIDSLLSDQYLNVPTTGNGKTLLGLTESNRDNRLKIHGPNELEQAPERSLMSYVIEQFDDKLVRILLVVALVSGLFGLLEVKEEMGEWASHWLGRALQFAHRGEKSHISLPASASMGMADQLVNDASDVIAEVLDSAATTKAHQFSFRHILEALIEPIVITTILIINALVGGYQSLNASKGISALTQMQAQKAVVKINSGENAAAVDEVEVDSRTLVPGDVVVLTVGQKIPADIRLVSVSTSSFTVDEACLTGESDSVAKMPYRGDASNEESSEKGAGTMGAHSKGMLYGGTVITAGKGIGVVVRTGMATEMGKVSHPFDVAMCSVADVLTLTDQIRLLSHTRYNAASLKQLLVTTALRSQLS